MSATRRAYAADDNILARLERDARRGKSAKPGPWKHTRLAWCLLASVLVIALIGTLASLARGNMAGPRQVPLAQARPVPAAPYANDVRGGFAPLPVPLPTRKPGAGVFDVPPEPALIPPMVMLRPAPAAAAKAAAMVAAPVAPKPAAKSPPERIAAARPAPARAGPAQPRPASPAPSRSVAAPSPSRAAAMAAVPARPKKSAAAAAPEQTAIDSDVALLSAIIMHASRHAAERAQMEAARCGAGKKCAPSDPIPSLNATD